MLCLIGAPGHNHASLLHTLSFEALLKNQNASLGYYFSNMVHLECKLYYLILPHYYLILAGM